MVIAHLRRLACTLLALPVSAAAQSRSSTVFSPAQVGTITIRAAVVLADYSVKTLPLLTVVAHRNDRTDSLTARTDLEGRLSMSLPVGAYTIRARTPQPIAGKSFAWAIPVTVRSSSQQAIDLTNANASADSLGTVAVAQKRNDNEPVAEPVRVNRSVDTEARASTGATRENPSDSAIRLAEPVAKSASTNTGPAAPAASATSKAQGTGGTEGGRPHTREGFWIGFGLGAGSLGCDSCDGERATGFSGNVKLGGTVNSRVLLGAETNGWYKSEDGVTLNYGNLSAVVYFYPSATGGFYLKGGLGLATASVDLGGFGSASETGSGAVLGLGYDARVGKNFSLTPYLNFLGGSFSGGTVNVTQFGLGFTWH